jgi:hypothetical protein
MRLTLSGSKDMREHGASTEGNEHTSQSLSTYLEIDKGNPEI